MSTTPKYTPRHRKTTVARRLIRWLTEPTDDRPATMLEPVTFYYTEDDVHELRTVLTRPVNENEDIW